jgi:hypothetical protein
MRNDDDSRLNIICLIIIVISLAWAFYCRLRVLEYVAGRGA